MHYCHDYALSTAGGHLSGPFSLLKLDHIYPEEKKERGKEKCPSLQTLLQKHRPRQGQRKRTNSREWQTNGPWNPSEWSKQPLKRRQADSKPEN